MLTEKHAYEHDKERGYTVTNGKETRTFNDYAKAQEYQHTHAHSVLSYHVKEKQY